MKELIITFAIAFSSIAAFAQENISFKIKNNSFIPKKLVLISYSPGDAGNGTQGVWMWPKDTKSFEFKTGTKLYMANQKQVNLVMGGKRIDQQKPFLVVSLDVQNKVISF